MIKTTQLPNGIELMGTPEEVGKAIYSVLREGNKKMSKTNYADQAWRQESVPSEEDVRMEQEEDEIADNRDMEQQELDAIERPIAQTKVEKEIRR